MEIRVFIVSDVALHRDGIACLLNRCPRVEVVRTIAPGQVAGESLESAAPDVALIDVPPDDVCAVALALRAAYPAARLIALGVAETEEEVIRCAEAGISGYSEPDGCTEDLVAVIDGVARDELVCPPRIAGRLMRHVAALAGGKRDVRLVRLTAREREIVELISEGLANKEIASRLCLELPTVKSHVHNILEKLEVRNRTEAANVVRTAAADEM